jgi:hypothetical protein
MKPGKNRVEGGGAWLWCLRPLSTISWRSVLLVEETGMPGVNHRPVASD